MAILLPIDPSKLPENWTLADTRNLTFPAPSLIEELTESVRRCVLARENLHEVFDSMTMRPELIAEIHCHDKTNATWRSITIASPDEDKLHAFLEKMQDEDFIAALARTETEPYTHLALDVMHTPLDADATYLINRLIDIKNVPLLFEQGVSERLAKPEATSYAVTYPVDLMVEDDHSKELFAAAQLLGKDLIARDSTVDAIIAGPSGFTVLITTFGAKTITHVPGPFPKKDKEGNLDRNDSSHIIANVSRDAKQLTEGKDINQSVLHWTVQVPNDEGDALTSILFGQV